MKSVILSCPTLKGELLAALAKNNADISVVFLPKELHRDPNYLHQFVQKTIDEIKDVDRIYLCATGCGGGTIGLKATTAEVVIPRTRDCLDILLSGNDIRKDDKRNIRGIYYTGSWMAYSKETDIDYAKLVEKMGQDAAEGFLRNLYKNFNEFYIIDTGCYDVAEVEAYLAPLVRVLNGTVEVIKGEYKILHKMVTHQIDEDFVVVPKGEVVQAGSFLPNM
ncbi:MAG: DUF1638 domain-containing protein [Phascolarctobacterium sp.]|nr:DUF1638 domain-containing protein [Phascolarctobacterium sp.]